MAFPQASDYRPPIIPDGEIYDNPENGKSYYWTQILLPEGSTPDTATSIGGYWTVVCDGTAQGGYLLRHGEDVLDCPGPVTYRWNSPTEFRAVLSNTPANYDSVYSTLTLDKDVLLSSNLDLNLLGNRKFNAASLGDFTVVAPRFQLHFIDKTQITRATNNIEEILIDNDGTKVTKTIDDTIHPQHIIPKSYVDQNIDIIQNEIIDLQEEIEAIAPSLDKGIWEFDNERFIDGTVSRPPLPGMYLLLKGDFPSWTYTNQYAEADAIVFNKIDYNNKLHENWNLIGTDKLIQLYDKPDPDFLLGGVKSVLDLGDTDNLYGDEAAVVKINRTESEGSPTNQGDVDGKYLTYVNIFSAPTGGSASEFVKKRGDTMTGDLTIDRSTGTNNVETRLTLTGERTSVTNPAAAIKFENKNSTTIGYLTYKSHGGDSWFTFTQDVDLNSKGLHSVARLRINSGGYIGSGTSERIIVKTGNGNDNGACTQIQRPADNKRTFAIRGKKKGASSQSDVFWVYANSGTTGDAIHYTGLITGDNHITNKKYVDDKVGGPYVNSSGGTITITKSGNNYYIS
jgi:hypothetical protein